MLRHALALALTFPAVAASSGPGCSDSCSGHDHSHDHSSDQTHLRDDEDEAWLKFHPHLSAAIAIGGSTSRKNLDLVAGGHAPIDDGFNLQGIEVGGLIEFGDRVSLFAEGNFFWDRFDDWDAELEEAYLSVDLGGGVSVRGGQFFAPFGIENEMHLHSRTFVEPPISIVRLLGEDGLIVQGGELAWRIPNAPRRTTFRVGYGKSRDHDHGGGRELRNELYYEALEGGEGHDDHDDHDDDHDDDDDDHDDDHGHDHEDEHVHAHGRAGNGGVYDAEDAYLDDGYFFARLETQICKDLGLNQVGISFAGGRNGFDRNTWIFGADVSGTYTLNDRPAWWRAEAFYRYVEAIDRAGIRGHFDEVGIYAASELEFADRWTTAVRGEWASGDRMVGNERRWRASANVGYLADLGSRTELQTRLQYSLDDLGGYTTEHSIWLQFVLNFGH